MSDPTTSDDLADSSESPKPYISPVLQKLGEDQRPAISPACETCPASLWFSTHGHLKCFCRQMHVIVWDGEADPVMTCDGREMALLELEKESEDSD